VKVSGDDKGFHLLLRAIAPALVLAALALSSCTEDAGFEPVPQPGLSLLPESVAVGPGNQVAFAVTLTRLACDSLIWYVNGVPGGDQVYGTITEDGLYTAPPIVPRNPVVRVRVVCASDTTYYDESVVTIVVSIQIELENFSHVQSDGGDPIRSVFCSGASGGRGVDGVDTAGDEFLCTFSVQHGGTYAPTLRAALGKGARVALLAIVQGQSLGGPQESRFDVVGQGFG